LFLQRRADRSFQLRGVVGHKVRQVAVFRVAPSRFDRVEFRSVGWQPLELDVSEAGFGNAFGGRAMNLPPVPADDQRPRKLLSQLPHESDDFIGTNVVVVDLERGADPSPHRRECDGADDAQAVVAIPGSLDGSFAARSPGAAIDGLQAKPGFVEKNNAGALSAGFFLMRGQSCRRQRSTAAASCSRATRRGFCGEKPRSCKMRRMWSRWYETPKFLRTTSETRAQVHKSVRYPAAIGPSSRTSTSDLRCCSESLHAGPGCGLAANPSTPSAFQARFQRFTLVKLTPKSVAISCRGFRSWKYSAARRRRASSSAALPGVLIQEHTVLAPARVHSPRRSQ